MGASSATPDPNKSATSKKQKPTLPTRLKKEDVHYLALEGGGGKGVTYIGAIEALEDLHVLPINKPPGKNQILGISGASAGAITALLLALGYSSSDIKRLLENKGEINSFFNSPPRCGEYRFIDEKGALYPKYVGDLRNQYQRELKGLSLIISALLPKKKDLSDPILEAIAEDVESYLYNLIFDRGLFPGFAVTEFFQNLLRKYFDTQPKPGSAASKKDYGRIDFQEFYDKTKIDLIFTGVNSTNKRTVIFSRQQSPNFSIADAVSISMNVPFLFKPVELHALALGFHFDGYGGGGYYVDGGVQNNLPLHAFDDFKDKFFDGSANNPNRHSFRVHPNVLGLRLTPGFPLFKLNEPPVPNNQSFFQTLFTYIKDIFDSLMAPSEEGQIRSPQEQVQTIELYTGDLSLTEFTPPQSKSEWPIKNAKEVVTKYFAQKSK